MSNVAVMEKTCSKCGDTKPLSEFYRQTTRPDGRRSECGECTKAAVRTYQESKRAELGEEAWREQMRLRVAKSRARGATKDLQQVTAYNAAMRRLREMYADAFAQMYREERYARGLDI